MNEVATALYEFWSSFGLPAFVEGYVPDDLEPDFYITYSLVQPDWRSQATHYARLWHRSKSYVEITNKIEEIQSRIGEGISIPCGDGFIAIFKDSQFVQFIPDADVDWKNAYLSLILEVNKS